MLTVYFDSCFYVWLKQAAPSVASATIDALNELHVRPVCSEQLIEEFARGRARTQKNMNLHARLTQLRPPLAIPEYVSWGILASGRGTAALSELSAHADAVRVAVALPEHPTASTVWADAKPEAVTKAQSPAFSRDIQNLLTTLRALSSDDQSTSKMVARLSECIARGEIPVLSEILGEEAATSQDLESRLRTSALKHDQRLLEVARGRAAGKLPNTIRDTEHMKVFIENTDRIDLLQVDSAQLNMMQRPDHEMARRGLVDRCFRASNLEDAIGQLRHRLSSAPDRLHSNQALGPAVKPSST